MPNNLITFEDEHLLAINKPAGWNTHSPSPYAGEGVYEWLKNREPRWSNLAIIHRLDKETSGLMLFSKTILPKKKFVIKSHLKRIGEKYASQRGGVSGLDAVTEFEVRDDGMILA